MSGAFVAKALMLPPASTPVDHLEVCIAALNTISQAQDEQAAFDLGLAIEIGRVVAERAAVALASWSPE